MKRRVQVLAIAASICLGRFAAVVAYDRPGNVNGLSERDGQLPTPRYIAERLHSLLAQLGLKPPYVLVGHSWGGPLIRMFAAVYPKEVAGLVYVDPTDLRTNERGRAYLRAQGYSDEALAEQKRQREALAAAAPDATAPSDGAGRPCEPMACHEQFVQFRTEWLRDFLVGATDSTFTIATASGHQIPHEDPPLVVCAIQRVISAAGRR